MALKAMLVLASVMAIAVALPAPEEQLEVSDIHSIQVPAEAIEQIAYAQDRSDDGWGWQPVKSSGWGWPKFKYLKFTIPIPILPRIKFGIKGGLKLNAAIQHPKGWGWSK